MPEPTLPVYQIQDFESSAAGPADFYLNSLENHLKTHAFIQKPHKHDFFILIFITAGTGTHTIDFITYPVQPQTVFFLSPGQVHSWQLSEDTAGYILFFSPAFYLLGNPEASLNQLPFFNNLLHKPILPLIPNQQELIVQFVQLLEPEYAQKQFKRDAIIRQYLNLLLAYLHRFYHEYYRLEKAPTGIFTQLQHLQNLIDLHFKEHLPVSFYADALHITVKQLNDTCRKALNKTTSDLIQSRVILEASRLLIHSGLNITQIAAELGYFDNAYFTRFFKKQTGQTPEQFRLQK